MGTVFSFVIQARRSRELNLALAQAVAWLHHVDSRFSTYRPDSQISRLADGTLTLGECDPVVSEVLAHCDALTEASGGWFTATPGGRLDPSGFVKGWAIERASTILHEAGFTDHYVNGGGDVQLRGESAPGHPWRIGLNDPADRHRLVAVVSGRDLAVATSGVSERGHHIIDPLTGRPAGELAALTLVGRHLTEVDALATAAFAMGDDAREWLRTRPDLEAFAVAHDGAVWWTPGLRDIAVLPQAPALP
ncbi:FAD:protein FMN transferase [Actinomadura barringtoniae]|nr:FAD:protein FMN transferase [Actinomadura barringtoniae]